MHVLLDVCCGHRKTGDLDRSIQIRSFVSAVDTEVVHWSCLLRFAWKMVWQKTYRCLDIYHACGKLLFPPRRGPSRHKNRIFEDLGLLCCYLDSTATTGDDNLRVLPHSKSSVASIPAAECQLSQPCPLCFSHRTRLESAEVRPSLTAYNRSYYIPSATWPSGDD